ncbi:MAG: ATP-binding protein, partial [Candidatus Kapabacteria bacterium]|nr:ATP-binding protein [Candidatus Kapabacteria bacterium]
SIADGRPKSFMEFDASAPYVLRQFSETLRQLLQSNITSTNAVFPVDNRLKEPLRKSFSESIFHEGRIMLDDRTGQKKLRMEVDGMSVPYITWSAGQKEFMPLLLGFYWLCPPSSTARRNSISHVVIEEPEMGLHPQAILSVILQILDLLSRGYKVILSTHSPVVLEFAWAFSILKKTTSDIAPLFELFNVPKDGRTKKIFENIIKSKKITTYYFHRTNEKVHAKNISSLDAGNDDKAISEWGGISSFATTAADIVSKYISKT